MKMESTAMTKPKTLAELLPGLGGLLSKNQMQNITLTATKKPRQTKANTLTSEKVFKPMTIAEMRTEFRALQLKSPRNNVQATASMKKKWNSSSKVENKTVSRTANGQMRHDTVRKALNFQQPKSKAPKLFANSRITLMDSATPKFPKPEKKAIKSLHLQDRNTVRISGVCNIVETPAIMNNPMKSRMTIANKENVNYQPNVYKKLIATPKSTLRKKVMASMASLKTDTPLSNESWKSSCDASFLQNEQDIEYTESQTTDLANEKTLDNIADVSPPVSTPFMEYQNVKDYFNNSSYVNEESCQNDTIMCFDNTVSTENGNREESVIVSLCDKLNKAAVLNTEKRSTELNDMLEVQKLIELNIKTMQNGIQLMNNIKESEIKSLQIINKLIQERKKKISESDKEKDVTAPKELPKAESKLDNDIGPCSEIKTNTKWPSYKIPKKHSYTIKKVFHKSMPNISGVQATTPQKVMGEKALSMYLKMKEHNNYLNTPLVKQRPMEVPDTPAITSHNLQMQLDKLYNESR